MKNLVDFINESSSSVQLKINYSKEFMDMFLMEKSFPKFKQGDKKSNTYLSNPDSLICTFKSKELAEKEFAKFEKFWNNYQNKKQRSTISPEATYTEIN